MAKCTVVYLHIYGKSTLIDLLYTPARGNHKKRRQARLRTQHHQITRLETLWSYILTPYRHLATAWIVLTIGMITLLLSLLPGMKAVWTLLQGVCHNVHSLWGYWIGGVNKLRYVATHGIEYALWLLCSKCIHWFYTAQVHEQQLPVPPQYMKSDRTHPKPWDHMQCPVGSNPHGQRSNSVDSFSSAMAVKIE